MPTLYGVLKRNQYLMNVCEDVQSSLQNIKPWIFYSSLYFKTQSENHNQKPIFLCIPMITFHCQGERDLVKESIYNCQLQVVNLENKSHL